MPSAKKLSRPPTPESHDPFQGRPCYEFNERLKGVLDDTFCYHCRHYLTTRCPHLDEFMDHLDDLESEYDAPPETHRQG
jgi:hypothetical protein